MGDSYHDAREMGARPRLERENYFSSCAPSQYRSFAFKRGEGGIGQGLIP